MSNHEERERMAYDLWVQRGRPEGSPDEDWHEAGRKMQTPSAAAAQARIDEPLDASFPSSDPPATHRPDEVPSNADEKWKSAGLKPRQKADGQLKGDGKALK